MTNKTEMVSVPRDLLLRLLSVYSASPYPAWHELAAALEAAHAEDARAVGEGPVAVMCEGGTVLVPGDCLDREIFEMICRGNTPLYRHPQRPIAKGGE